MLTYRQANYLEVISYFNVDFASGVDSRKSTSGYIFMLIGGVVSWRSMEQTLIATSPMEVKLVSYFEAT